MDDSRAPKRQVTPFPKGEERRPGTDAPADGSLRATMICVDSGLDGLTGCFAIDDAGNWIGIGGEVVKYADEDMDSAVARMRSRG